MKEVHVSHLILLLTNSNDGIIIKEINLKLYLF